MSGDDRQLTFDIFEDRPGLARADFLVSDSNEAAFRAATDWTTWPDGRLVLTGPAGSGKSHLAAIWLTAIGGVGIAADTLTESRLRALLLERAILVEDVPRIAKLPGPARRQCEEMIFHLWNHAAAEDVYLLMTGRGAPAHWPILTPDLASRLQGTAKVDISPPDDALLSSLLVKMFADRQLHVAPDVVEYLVRRIERSFEGVSAAVAELDRRALTERRKISRPFAARLFGGGDKTDEE